MYRTVETRGFTLIELAIALAVLALVAALAATRYGPFRQEARITMARNDLQTLRDAFCGSPAAPGYLDDMGAIPGFEPGHLRVANLLCATNLYTLDGLRADLDATGGPHRSPAAAFTNWNEVLHRGWRGPYVRLHGTAAPADAFPAPGDRRSGGDATFAERGFFPRAPHLSLPGDYQGGLYAYGFPGEPALLDPWGDPYVLQIPPAQAFVTASGGLAEVSGGERFRYARLVSAGPDGILSTPCFFANTNASGSAWSAAQRRASIFAGRPEERGDDLVLFLSREDRYRDAYGHEGDER